MWEVIEMLAKLKCRILEKDKTQSIFAVSCGKSEGWISRIIQGRDIATKEDKELICHKLRIKNPEDYF